jgi:hypothetical protein
MLACRAPNDARVGRSVYSGLGGSMPAAVKKSLSTSLSAAAWISASVGALASSSLPARLPSADTCRGTLSTIEGLKEPETR